jgi:peptidoglycan/LPS O-acetylase OafA/YrhL
VVLGKITGRAGLDPIAVNLGLFDGWFLILIVALASGRGTVARILGSPPAQVLGESSYALYILHWPLWFWFTAWMDDATTRSPAVLGTYLVGVVIVSMVVWRVLERPARRSILGRRRAAAISTVAG